jgi:hypothetical protein
MLVVMRVEHEPKRLARKALPEKREKFQSGGIVDRSLNDGQKTVEFGNDGLQPQFLEDNEMDAGPPRFKSHRRR